MRKGKKKVFTFDLRKHQKCILHLFSDKDVVCIFWEGMCSRVAECGKCLRVKTTEKRPLNLARISAETLKNIALVEWCNYRCVK